MMKCLHCGADNAADAKFCKSCGQPLESEIVEDTAVIKPVDAYDADPGYGYDEVEAKKPVDKKKGVIIAASVAAIIVLLVLSVFIYRTSRRISLEKSAAAAIEDENYDKAREQYEKLYDMIGRSVYKDRATEAKTMAKDVDLLTRPRMPSKAAIMQTPCVCTPPFRTTKTIFPTRRETALLMCLRR